MTTQPTYTHPKIAATIRAYLRRTPNPTYHDIRRDIHKHGGRINTTLLELETQGEIILNLDVTPETYHLTTTHDTNPGTNATTPTETQPAQPIEGWLTEVNTGTLHPRWAAHALDDLDDRLGLAYPASGPDALDSRDHVDALRELLVALVRDFRLAATQADRDYPEEAEQLDPGAVVDKLAESIGYRREGDRLVKVASDEGENRATLCRCGHSSKVHEQGTPGRCSRCGCDRFGRPADLPTESAVSALSEQIAGHGRVEVGPPYVGGRVTIDPVHGVRVRGKDGEVFHMPAEGGFHRDVAGKPCKADPLVVLLQGQLERTDGLSAPDQALEVAAWLADQGLLADPPERA